MDFGTPDHQTFERKHWVTFDPAEEITYMVRGMQLLGGGSFWPQWLARCAGDLAASHPCLTNSVVPCPRCRN